MTKFSIELENGNKIQVVVKGDQHELIKTILLAMEQYPLVAEVILFCAKEFLSKNKFNLHL